MVEDRFIKVENLYTSGKMTQSDYNYLNQTYKKMQDKNSTDDEISEFIDTRVARYHRLLGHKNCVYQRDFFLAIGEELTKNGTVVGNCSK